MLPTGLCRCEKIAAEAKYGACDTAARCFHSCQTRQTIQNTFSVIPVSKEPGGTAVVPKPGAAGNICAACRVAVGDPARSRLPNCKRPNQYTVPLLRLQLSESLRQGIQCPLLGLGSVRGRGPASAVVRWVTQTRASAAPARSIRSTLSICASTCGCHFADSIVTKSTRICAADCLGKKKKTLHHCPIRSR